ncbi:ABC transporter permease [Salinispira pacifica]|uniref:ABC transporter associated permease n=1 Tax=Salinispira pacifica TaxID=1307761 RepID=V5WLI4_9SPIO|nr:FtsX-like permease family protein [Salinispira pacifica]AHC16474.1 ABC transporter associated permease [Salinispira pacifica]
MIRVLKLSFRNFTRNLSRYRILIMSMVLATAAMVVVLGLLMGISSSVEKKAARYFAGHIAFQEFSRAGVRSVITDSGSIEDLVDDLNGVQAVSRRSVYYQSNASIFYNGYYARQRRLVGVEWNREAEVLAELNITSGTVPSDYDPDGVLISTATAERLNARVGDRVIISLKTSRGQSNTASLIVRGIFNESSFFGYTSYMQRQTLNSIMNVPAERVNEMGVYFTTPRLQRTGIEELRHSLEQSGISHRILQSREARDTARSSIEEPTIMLLTLDAQLAEIKDLVDAITIVAVGVIFLFLLIVVIGVSNTYSMIVYERIKEIGTLRAIGLTRNKTVALFLGEAGFLGVTSLLLGMFMGVLVLSAIHAWLDFSFAGFATLFLENGRVAWKLPAVWLVSIALITLAASLVGALRPSIDASRLAPVDAMRQE